MEIKQDDIGEEIASIQERITYLTHKLEEYNQSKRSLEKENLELSTGYNKILTAKRKIIDEDDNYIREIKKGASGFPPALKCVHSFCDSVQDLVNGVQNQNCLSLLQEAIDKIKKHISNNESSIEKFNYSIYTTNTEITNLRAQLNSIGG